MRITAALILALLSSIPAHAWRNPCCSDFETGFELLYFRPSLPNRTIAIEDDRSIDEIIAQPPYVSPQATPIKIHISQTLGWRVFIGFVNKATCWDVRAEYTMHHEKRSKDAVEDLDAVYWPALAFSGILNIPLINGTPPDEQTLNIDGFFRHNLDTFDLSLGKRCTFKRRLWLRISVSLHYAFLADRLEVYYQGFTPQEFFTESVGRNTLVTAVDRQRTWGIGPRIGVQGYFCLAGNLSISGRAIGGLLLGDSRIHQTEHGLTEFIGEAPLPVDTNITGPSQSSSTPMANLRAGLTYTLCELPCFSALIEVGYEYLAYYHAFHSHSRNYALHGPYFRLWLSL